MFRGLRRHKSFIGLTRDVFILSAGIFVAQLIPLLLQPVLKRIFGPEDFGSYDVYLKTFSILVAVSSLKYENAILLPKKDSESKHVMYVCLIISVVLFILSLLAIFFLKGLLLGTFRGITLFSLTLLPFSVLSYSVFNVFNMYLIRRQKFLLSSSSKISRRLSEGIIQLVFGLLNNAKGLLIGDLIGNAVQGIFSFWKASLITSFRIVNKIRLKKVFAEYWELPVYTLIPNLLNTFVLGALTFLILIKFDLEAVGYIEFTQKILSIPSVLISIAISQVVFQRVSQLIIRKKRILPLLVSVVAILISIALFFVLVIEFFGAQLFLIIGGPGWENSGIYAKILVYAAAVMLVFSPLGKVLIALKKFRLNSLWEILKFGAILLLFYIDGIAITQYLEWYTYIIIIFYTIYGGIIFYQSYKYQVENQIST